MSSNDVQAIKKEVQVYLAVFGTLIFLTVVTVAVSYLHLSLFWAISIALLIASVKVTLVGGYFMHLFSERVLVYLILFFVAIFVIGVLVLPVFEHHDAIPGTIYQTPAHSTPLTEHTTETHH